MAKDSALLMRYGDRVPYIVTNAIKGTQLKDMVRHASSLIEDDDRDLSPVRINVEHYVLKHLIPSLNRIFNLIGVDFMAWYVQLPKLKQRVTLFNAPLEPLLHRRRRRTNDNSIESFYSYNDCAVCHRPQTVVSTSRNPPVCRDCLTTGRADAILKVEVRRLEAERCVEECHVRCIRCLKCVDHGAAQGCRSVDCDNMFERRFAMRRLREWELLHRFICDDRRSDASAPPTAEDQNSGLAPATRPGRSRSGASPRDPLLID